MAKFRLSAIFNSKKSTAIASLIIAVVFWFTITLIENPEAERVVGSVPLYLDTNGTAVDEQGLSIIGDVSEYEKVNVRISGASYIVNSITPEDILVKPTFDGVNAADKYSLKLEATNNTSKNFVIESISPESVQVEFDYIDDVDFDVKIKVRNAVADEEKGFTLGKEIFTNSKSVKLKVKGPRSVVSKIHTVMAEANADNTKKLTATESYDASIKLYDEKKQEIDTEKLQLSFTKVSVSVQVNKVKTVPVKCTYNNKPEDFTPVASVIVGDKEISKVEIEGNSDIIDDIDFIELEPIDFREFKKSNNEFKRKLTPPTGVIITDGVTEAKVKIDDSALKNKTFKINNVVAINNKNNYKVKLASDLSVKICGQESVINSLNASDLYAEIDLDGKALGDQTLSINVKSSVKDNVWQINTYDAKVTVFK